MMAALLVLGAVVALGVVMSGRCWTCGGHAHSHAMARWLGPIKAWGDGSGAPGRWCGVYLGPLRLHRKWQDDLPADAQPCLVAHLETGDSCRRVAALYVRGLGPVETQPSWCGGRK